MKTRENFFFFSLSFMSAKTKKKKNRWKRKTKQAIYITGQNRKKIILVDHILLLLKG